VLTPALYAQQGAPAIEQSRLLDQQQQPVSPNANVNADGMALGGTNETSDDSFGNQAIVKSQERYREFAISGDASLLYTSNVALTRAAERSDGFFVGGASAAWNPKISTHFQLQFIGRTSIFRYFDTSALDFENFNVAVALSYPFPQLPTLSAFVRYDFIELLTRGGDQLLMDHEFTAGLQNVFVLGRSHALTVGVLASTGISDPFAQQRSQISGFVGYHLNLTRALSTDLLYRISGNFYSNGDRNDANQLVTWTLRYAVNDWVEAQSFLSLGMNRSSASVFDYNVFTGGGGIALNVRF
jgi:hypothetical protein